MLYYTLHDYSTHRLFHNTYFFVLIVFYSWRLCRHFPFPWHLAQGKKYQEMYSKGIFGIINFTAVGFLPRTKEWHWLITDCFSSLFSNLFCIRLLPLQEMRRSLSGPTILSTTSGTVVRLHQNVLIMLKPPLFWRYYLHGEMICNIFFFTPCFNISIRTDLQLGASSLPLDCAYYIHTCNI